ncbi:MAG: VapC toxin family PIN domain ribonuclease [Proteobacteria bacterium]|nr:VapC toxin family PIN domain ribonuclease [Pseudomonadota bacterium]
MILVDSSIWIDHLRATDARLSALLVRKEAVVHPFVLGELLLGMGANRPALMETFGDLPQAKVATRDEVLVLIDRHRLYGRGIGYVDAHLIASALLMIEARVWSRDRRLMTIAGELGIAAPVG